MKKQSSTSLIMINCVYILALLIVITPLLILGNYNYPTADDWSFGEKIYHARQNGGGMLTVMKSVFDTVRYNYTNWEGRFSIAFLSSLQPGVWGEQYYKITTWLMIGSVVFAEVLLARYFIVGERIENRGYYLPVVLPALILQILYVPFPDETFYWYTGSVNYTFIYSVSLVLIVLFLSLAKKSERARWKTVLMSLIAVLLAVLIGGNNFATSLSTLLALCCLSLLFFIYDKSALKRTWFVPFGLGAALLVSIFAPAITVRVNANFGGETENAVSAVINSLIRSFTNLISWTDAKIYLLLVLIVPFLWKAVKNQERRFRCPALFTVLTFGIYASQCTATMYVDGTTGGGRMADILYYTYYVWVIGNVWYWLGWLSGKYRDRINGVCQGIWRKCCGLIWVVAAMAVCLVCLADKKELSSYKAYRNLRQGWAQQYAKEWEERIDILKDESAESVEVAPLSVLPEMLYYTDLQYKDGYYWVNEACARYYGKKFVDLITSE